MKNFFSLLLALSFAIILMGCGNKTNDEPKLLYDGIVGQSVTKDDVTVTISNTVQGDAHNLDDGVLYDRMKNNYLEGTALSIAISFENRNKSALYLHRDTVFLEYADGFILNCDDFNSTDAWSENLSPLTSETYHWAIILPQEVQDSQEQILIHVEPWAGRTSNDKISFVFKYR